LAACLGGGALLLKGFGRYFGVLMKRTALLALSTLLLAGCDDIQLSRSAQWAVDHISYASAGFGGWEYGDLERGMRRRQQQWDYHNRYHSGGRPGWDGQVCSPGAILDPCRSHRGGRRLAVMLAPEMNAPALGREEKSMYEKVGKAYGIGLKASLVLLESLNRAAVGDFGGLKGMGLSGETIASAQKNQGRLDKEGLSELSRALGLSPRKADALIQSIFGKREVYDN
jgi:hypothetical protein